MASPATAAEEPGGLASVAEEGNAERTYTTKPSATYLPSHQKEEAESMQAIEFFLPEWLDARLAAERKAVNEQLEERHAAMLQDFRKAVNDAYREHTSTRTLKNLTNVYSAKNQSSGSSSRFVLPGIESSVKPGAMSNSIDICEERTGKTTPSAMSDTIDLDSWEDLTSRRHSTMSSSIDIDAIEDRPMQKDQTSKSDAGSLPYGSQNTLKSVSTGPSMGRDLSFNASLNLNRALKLAGDGQRPSASFSSATTSRDRSLMGPMMSDNQGFSVTPSFTLATKEAWAAGFRAAPTQRSMQSTFTRKGAPASVDDVVTMIESEGLGIADCGELPRVSRCLIDPDTSIFLQRWDFVTIMALVYIAIVTPIQVAMMEARLDAAFYINLLVDAVFVLDLILQFFLMYHKRQAYGYQLEFRHSAIIRHYLKTWFAIDMISIMPFDAVSIFTDSSHIEQVKAVKVVRLLRLLKLVRVLRASRVLRRYELKMQLSYQGLALMKFFVVLIAIMHWMSCFWALSLKLVEEDAEQPRWVDTLSEDEEGVVIKTKDSHWKLYITCFYFTSYTITSVGYGDIRPRNIVERVVATLIICLSGVAWAMVLGQVCAIVGNMSSDDKAFRTTMDELNWMMQDRQLPVHMRRRLRNFFLSNKEAQRHNRQETIIKAMSTGLQSELSMQLNRVWIVKVSFLKEFLRKAERSGDRHLSQFIGDVSKSLQKEVHAQMEIFGYPQVLYILNRGLVIEKAGRIMRMGDVWGKDFVLSDFKLLEPPECYSLTYVELMILKRDVFMDLVEQRSYTCPMIQRRVRRFWVRLAVQRGIMAEAKARLVSRNLSEIPGRIRESASIIPESQNSSFYTAPSWLQDQDTSGQLNRRLRSIA